MSQQASGTPARMARRSGGMYHVPAGRTAQRPPVHVAPHVRRHWLRTRALPHLFLDCLRRHFLSAIVSTHWRMTVFGENGGRAGAGGETGGEGGLIGGDGGGDGRGRIGGAPGGDGSVGGEGTTGGAGGGEGGGRPFWHTSKSEDWQ